MQKMDELTTKVQGQAMEDAVAFVEEFEEPLDPSATDWDGTAWSDLVRTLNLTSDQAGSLWPLRTSSLSVGAASMFQSLL